VLPTSFSLGLTPKRMIPARGEVWLFDLGLEGKVRPALIVSVAYDDLDRALLTHWPAIRVASHTGPSRASIRKAAPPSPAKSACTGRGTAHDARGLAVTR
jgi:hypothetical protein